MGKDFDFRGWATKSGTLNTDGTVIQHNAFHANDGGRVPLVWNHQRNEPTNIIGHVDLEQRPEGMYAFGSFNNTDTARAAKESLQHGDITSMSIGANRIKRDQLQHSNITGGNIFEVSLVIAGANPGAMIEEVVQHSDADGETAIIYNGLTIRDSEDELEHADKPAKEEPKPEAKAPEAAKEDDEEEPTMAGELSEEQLKAAFDSMTQEQLAAVQTLVDNDEDEEDTTDEVQQGDDMQYNVFEEGANPAQEGVLIHSALNDALKEAIETGTSLQEAIEHNETLEHADKTSLSNPEIMFPEAKSLSNQPQLITQKNLATDEIISGVSKSPFSRIRMMNVDISNMSEEELRAKGYIKGNEKKEIAIEASTRETHPQTIYVKSRLNRDDIVDITDFDIVAYMQNVMRIKLNESLAQAILVGDGRDVTDESKIKEANIRPIWGESSFYAKRLRFGTLAEFIDGIPLELADMMGTGVPAIYMNPKTLVRMTRLRDANGHFLFGDPIPNANTLASVLGVSKIVPTAFLKEGQITIGNLTDYTVGSTKGGEITSFNDFDIDFNQYKYLIETRLSGALTQPHSFLTVNITDATDTSNTVVGTTTKTKEEIEQAKTANKTAGDAADQATVESDKKVGRDRSNDLKTTR